MTKKLLAGSIALSVAVLAGCGAGGDAPDMAAAMSAAGAGVIAPGNIQNETPDNVDQSAVVVEELADTNTLMVADDFAFDTSSVIDIDFDLEAARNQQASVSICTNYLQDDLGYDIDYDSCSVRGNLENGVFNHSMEVTNEFSSVVAVVWFLDPSMDPVHREFSIQGSSSADRSVMTVNGNKVIVWR